MLTTLCIVLSYCYYEYDVRTFWASGEEVTAVSAVFRYCAASKYHYAMAVNITHNAGTLKAFFFRSYFLPL